MKATGYAMPVKRFSSIVKRHDAEYAAKQFAVEVDKTFVKLEKYGSGYSWTACLVDESGVEVSSAVVTCPHCGEINVCWGEFGDPAAELAICSNSECGKNYTTEPF